MITERHEELAALHALGLLDGNDRSAFESELSGSQEFQGLVASLAEPTAALALAAPSIPVPAGLKASVLAACTPSSETDRPAPAATVEFPLWRYVPWAAAAAFALSTTWFATQAFSFRSQNDSLRAQQRLDQIAYESARNQLAERSLVAEQMITELGQRLQRSENLARLKVSALASLAGNTAEARAIAVWDPEQQAGLLTFEKLPAIADEQDYQIWVIDPAYQNPVNGGVFHVARDGSVSLAFRPDQPVTRATAFAISLEKKGGVPKAEGPIVLLGKLPEI
ncbi:anti-sigma factor [Oleiharenicola lentus]|jgi:anti-sigma-K factor RskA|uniref:Regulator of SigK n=1 Tax=Oleiharenicola lentus TaxID=2508720 RepID=A0A4Q1CAU8_9BACT|nr:anti-sigma factor [Oleiharenicola lentus]RXK56011.1 anti-sigma factor [Oleiharenicola lentus]